MRHSLRKGERTSIRVVPSASRLVSSLRDLGYDFPQAVADLVDNSLTAGASRISIDLCFEGPDSWLRITDNGGGMSGETITEAMRYGSDQSYDDGDLGKFGLGLKTASLSQCRRLSVASCCNSQSGRVVARMLDLDHVVESDAWEIFALSAAERDSRLVDPLRSGTGTVVLWEALDRVLGYKVPRGGHARSGLEGLAAQLAEHLGMVFHRFLSGEVIGLGPIKILVNRKSVEAWDPFARDEPETVTLPASQFDLAASGRVGLVDFEPYVLPAREAFSSEKAFHRMAGPRRWNAQQGLYIYRANRMIQSGGWSRLRALDEHVKLARAALNFHTDLDSAFEINVAKVRAVLPADLRERLQAPVEMLVQVAQATYRAHAREGEGTPSPMQFEKGTVRAVGQLIRPALEEAARTTGGQGELGNILRTLRKANPSIARLMGW